MNDDLIFFFFFFCLLARGTDEGVVPILALSDFFEGGELQIMRSPSASPHPPRLIELALLPLYLSLSMNVLFSN